MLNSKSPKSKNSQCQRTLCHPYPRSWRTLVRVKPGTAVSPLRCSPPPPFADDQTCNLITLVRTTSHQAPPTRTFSQSRCGMPVVCAEELMGAHRGASDNVCSSEQSRSDSPQKKSRDLHQNLEPASVALGPLRRRAMAHAPVHTRLRARRGRRMGAMRRGECIAARRCYELSMCTYVMRKALLTS